MAYVYRLSAGNLVYLGEDDSNVSKALASIKELMESINRETNHCKLFRAIVFTDSNAYRYADTGIELSRQDFRFLLALYQLPWFTRLWVIQEVALAPSNTCYCGTSVFDLLDILRVARWLTYKQLHIPIAVTRSKGRVVANLMWDYVDHEQVLNLVIFTVAEGSYSCARPKYNVGHNRAQRLRLWCSRPYHQGSVFGAIWALAKARLHKVFSRSIPGCDSFCHIGASKPVAAEAHLAS